MNEFYKYLDLPKVPESLLCSINDICNRTPINLGDSHLDNPKDPSNRKHCPIQVNDRLFSWLTDIFSKDIIAWYVVSKTMLPTHVDGRQYCYNYILETGGDDVRTYAEMGNNHKEFIKFEPKRWIKLNNHIPHGTIGNFKNGPRILLQITPAVTYKHIKDNRTNIDGIILKGRNNKW